MKKDKFYLKKLIVLFVAVIVALTGFGACSPIKEITEAAELTTQDIPSWEDTIISLLEINRAMEAAMSRGETELTFNAAGVSEDELKNISDNMSTFWGKPLNYMITGELTGIEGIIPGRAVDVQTITNSFELSNNYYIYDYIRHGTEIPEDRPHAKEIAAVLPGIAAEIFSDPAATDFDKTLAAHDWLVINLDYDMTAPAKGEENGTYGAIILKRTMCQGYAEALELLLRCYTDVEIVQIVGEAKNIGSSGFDPDVMEGEGAEGADGEAGGDAADGTAGGEAAGAGAEPGEGAGAGEGADAGEGAGAGEGEGADAGPAPPPEPEWGGHAWNAVRLNGAWYQVDATFDDPIGGESSTISHFYFGQTDELMSRNHRWAAEYFPVSNTRNFLYFRQKGLFAEDWDEFQAILTDLLTEAPIELVEIAVRDASIDESNIQFVYKARNDLEMLYWSEQIWEDIHVHSIELYYEPEPEPEE